MAECHFCEKHDSKSKLVRAGTDALHRKSETVRHLRPRASCGFGPVALVKKRVGRSKLTSRGNSLTTDVSVCILFLKQELRDSQRQVGAGAPRGGVDGFAECPAWQWASPGRGHCFNMSPGAFRRAGANSALGIVLYLTNSCSAPGRSTISDHIASYAACYTYLIGQNGTFESISFLPGAARGCRVHARLLSAVSCDQAIQSSLESATSESASDDETVTAVMVRAHFDDTLNLKANSSERRLYDERGPHPFTLRSGHRKSCSLWHVMLCWCCVLLARP